jgi:hypothetical protein
MELVRIELWEKVVNVENDFRTHQTRQPRREDQKVGNRMDMHELVRLANVIDADADHRPQKKQRDPD